MSRTKKGPKGKRKNALSHYEVLCDVTILLTGVQYQFDCQRCGACCIQSHPIDVDEQEIPLMAEALDISVQEFVARYLSKIDRQETGIRYLDDFLESMYPGLNYVLKEDQPCPFFDFGNHLCKIYPVRPAMCRLYPFVNLNMVDFDWQSKIIAIKSTFDCPATRPNLLAFEQWLKIRDKEANDMHSRNSEASSSDRAAGIRYHGALRLGHEDEIKEDNGLSPKQGALERGFQAYLRLRMAGWQLKFDHRNGNLRRSTELLVDRFDLQLAPVPGLPGALISVPRNVKKEVIRLAV